MGCDRVVELACGGKNRRILMERGGAFQLAAGGDIFMVRSHDFKLVAGCSEQLVAGGPFELEPCRDQQLGRFGKRELVRFCSTGIFHAC